MSEEKKDTTKEEKKEEAPKPAEVKAVKEEKKDEKTDKKSADDKKDVKDVKEEVKISEVKPGMTIRIYQKIKELNVKGEEKERVQYFEGMVIAKKHGTEAGGTITVRKVSDGVGVEKIFPLNLPTIKKIEIKKQARVRRAKLGYLKEGYKKRLKETKIS